MDKKKTGHVGPVRWELKDLPAAATGHKPAGADLSEIIREKYREPIVADDQIYAEINGRNHRISDIGNRGLGIIIPSFGGFLAGSVHSVTLHIDGKIISLQGIVAHVSPHESSGECHCGIEFIGMSQKDEQILQNFLTTHHARLFGETSRSADLGRD